MDVPPLGRVLAGNAELLRRSREKWERQAVDLDMPAAPGDGYDAREATLAAPVSVVGPGTFMGRAQRKLTFLPAVERGWFFDRTDLPESLPIPVSAKTVWTTVRNIVLCSGSPHNYMRMVEHIIALRVGMGIDNLLIRMDSGDPPLFERSSLDLVEAFDAAGTAYAAHAAPVFSVKEPVTVAGPRGSFLTLLPAEPRARGLRIDCAVDFRSAIGRQRIRFDVTPRTFRHGARARTNSTFAMLLYTLTIGKVFADVRNLGYTLHNILIASRWRYVNRPLLVHNGKALEAVWHRAVLDLLAAVALLDRGRLAGTLLSYKAGHALDVQLMQALVRYDLLEEI
jgi:UDP-3-O-acyl-N-acetylglucosamine deacetylase